MSNHSYINKIYTCLFFLSLVIINPWGNSKGEIWTLPKLEIVALICFFNLLIIVKNFNQKISRTWFISFSLWASFLIMATISTIKSPLPMRSIFGQSTMRDGLIYWILIAFFTLSNSLVIAIYPKIVQAQFQGLIFGGIVLSLSIFPQVINWRIDYTAKMGQLIQKNILASSIFQGQQPIGLYSNTVQLRLTS